MLAVYLLSLQSASVFFLEKEKKMTNEPNIMVADRKSVV